ncbi:VCBS repeat-containing protein [bacterium]|nr:VCBS repeat-containing protein [candidate division CSSED10-310 bacterium]
MKLGQCFIIGCFFILTAIPCLSQELTFYEVVDNASVGLTVAPFAKGGLALSDIDRNGYPDIFCLRWNSPGYSRIYVNEGGVFQDIADQSPLEQIENLEDGTRTTMWVDYDNDGDRDLSMATTEGIHLLRNDNNVFTEVSAEMGFVAPKPGGFIVEWDCNTCGWADYDLDGDLDFFKASRSTEDQEYDELWENRDGTYFDVSNEVGFINQRFKHRGMTFGDFDNDGDQDIFMDGGSVPGFDNLFVNDEVSPGVRSFADVAEFTGITKTGDRKGCGFFDYNRDGFLDIYMPSAEFNHILYRNAADNGANWVGFILEGTVSNRDAVNSLVTLYTGEKNQIRLTRCGDNHFHQYNPWVHFGIGFDTEIDSVVIRWPLGLRQVLKDVAINQYHLARDSNVSLAIHNLRGEEVTSLFSGDFQSAGYRYAKWDGKDKNGHSVPTGVYIYQLRAGDFAAMKKMTFIK